MTEGNSPNGIGTLRASESFPGAQEWAPVCIPTHRRHHGRQIGCDGIARVIVKRDVKADSMTPASLK
jgi:hypothetical protein